MNPIRIRDRLFAPWEKPFDRLLTPLEDFVEEQSSSSIILLTAAILALVLANSPLAEHYFHFIHGKVGFSFGDFSLEKSLHHWINDGLMVMFFFVVGLEIKRELLTGELSELQVAVTPLAAAIGGMVVPAAFFMLVNNDPTIAHAWGVPIATDIAFAVAALMLVSERVPKSLVAFLVALAIVDDLGGVLVIALFYTETIYTQYLAWAGAIVGVLFALNRTGVRSFVPYLLFGAVLWFVLLKSGLHATLAGVITAFAIPNLSRYDPELFPHRLRRLIGLYENTYSRTESFRRSQRLRAILSSMETGLHGIRSPAYRLEHALHLPVAFLVVPIFAFANSGITLTWDVIHAAIAHPLTHGIFAGLVIGKTVGITGAVWLVVRLGWGEMPRHSTLTHIIGVSLLAGIGFTMSMFISELAFNGEEPINTYAKIGIIGASVFAGAAGLLCLRFLAPAPAESARVGTTTVESAVSLQSGH